MANPKLSSGSDHLPDPAAPANTRTRRLLWASVAVLIGLAVNLSLCVRRGGGDRGALAFVAFSHLNLLLLFLSSSRFERSPPGSPSRGRARLAVWVLTTTLTAAFTWKMGALLPLPLAIAAWVMAAAAVGGGFYVLFVLDNK
ncbi:uncharacterized protein LOC133927853 [Phragmites australis]|uniref:uncharacterized protein LOC133927853 n=1 Tax=Phragmites australis TaxID=29695 RepID=UPI002D7A32A8|nr:uncharacterized protein LOC133927853 [Phragmites australis]